MSYIVNNLTPRLLVGIAICLATCGYLAYRWQTERPLEPSEVTTLQTRVTAVEQILRDRVPCGFLFVQSDVNSKLFGLVGPHETFDIDAFLTDLDKDKDLPFLFSLQSKSLRATQGPITGPIIYAEVVGVSRGGDRVYLSLEAYNAWVADKRRVWLVLFVGGVIMTIGVIVIARRRLLRDPQA